MTKNINAIDELNTKILELTTLYEITKKLGSSLNLESMLNSTMDILANKMGMRRGTLTVLDRETKELKIEVAHGLTKEEKERGRYKIGEGITGKVLESGQPMVIPDIEAEPLFLNRTRARKNLEERKFAFLCVPIKAGNRVIGALSVDRLFKSSISYEEDVKLLTIIASMVGQAVKIRELAEKD